MTPKPHEVSPDLAVTPEVTLFIGGAVVSIALIAVMLVFWWKVSKQEAAAEKDRQARRSQSTGGEA
jgi:hypothetical protein